MGILGHILEHHPNFWNTTPSAQQPEHQPPSIAYTGWGFWCNFLEHHSIEPPTRPRATSYMVRILVQPLEQQGHQPDRGGFWDTFRLGERIFFPSTKDLRYSLTSWTKKRTTHGYVPFFGARNFPRTLPVKVNYIIKSATVLFMTIK